MELGISGRNATLVNRQERYCKSCRSIHLHLLFEEMDINFSVCLVCVARYVRELPRVEVWPMYREMVGR